MPNPRRKSAAGGGHDELAEGVAFALLKFLTLRQGARRHSFGLPAAAQPDVPKGHQRHHAPGSQSIEAADLIIATSGYLPFSGSA